MENVTSNDQLTIQNWNTTFYIKYTMIFDGHDQNGDIMYMVESQYTQKAKAEKHYNVK